MDQNELRSGSKYSYRGNKKKGGEGNDRKEEEETRRTIDAHKRASCVPKAGLVAVDGDGQTRWGAAWDGGKETADGNSRRKIKKSPVEQEQDARKAEA